jgi:hypothetical protein
MTKFSTTLPIIIYDRPTGSDELWQDFDSGPGFFETRPGYEINIRVHNIDNQTLKTLVADLVDVPELAFLNLSENRKITDPGLEALGQLKQLKGLNLSSCDITGPGLSFLAALTHLEHLNLSYCNRIADLGIRMVKSLRSLVYLDLQGCVKITRGGMSKIDRRGLVIHYK